MANGGFHPERMRVWLVHDWLTGMRGGEKVLLELVRLFPQAKIATLFCVPGSVDQRLEERVGATSFLQGVPGIAKIYRHLLPILPAAIADIRLDECDVVISTCHCVAKGVTVPRGAKHLSYCFTPMRYIWETRELYFGDRPSLASRVLELASPVLRDIDLKQNEGVDRFATTCVNVAGRIERCYRREALVVYPGVDEELFSRPLATKAEMASDPFYLVVSALVPYKRVDVAVQVFAADRRRKLVVIGKGPEEGALRAMAGDAGNVVFMGWQSDEVVQEHYRRCAALVFPGEEDFGLVPIEVQATGRPVIAYGKGGIVETLKPETGVLYVDPSVEGLQRAIERFESRREGFDPEAARQNAARFRWSGFDEGILAALRGL